MRGSRASLIASAAGMSLLIGAALSGCAPAPSYTYRSTGSSTYSSSYDPTANLRRSSIDTVKKMAEVNESVAGTKTDAELIDLTKEAVRGDLKDPGSAQFRNVTVHKIEAGRVVCGEVNAKNSYGGYVGFKEFVGGVAAATIESTGSRYPKVDRAANAGMAMACR